MSQLSLATKSGYIKAPLANGIGRCVVQCQRMTIKFCLSSGGSQGARDFIEHDLVSYARAHPETVIYLKPRRHRSSVLIAEYLNGHREWMSLHQMPTMEIRKWVESYRTRAGYPEMHYRSYLSTQIPSIQGVWTPFTHKPINRNLLRYPEDALNVNPLDSPSATEIVSKLYGDGSIPPPKPSQR